MMEVASSYEMLLSTRPYSITAQKIHIFTTYYWHSLHSWFITWSEGFFKSILVMPRGLNRCLEVTGLSDNWMWTDTVWMLAIFCTKCMSCCSHKMITTSSWCQRECYGLPRPSSNSYLLSNRWNGSVFCPDNNHFLQLQAVWCHRLLPGYPSSFITCHPFLLTLWCPSTTLNITSNLNMSALSGDARKLGCRNWLRVTRKEADGNVCLRRPRITQGCRADDDKVRWSYSYAFIRPRNKTNFISTVLNNFLRN
jgi:hypothetical protein